MKVTVNNSNNIKCWAFHGHNSKYNQDVVIQSGGVLDQNVTRDLIVYDGNWSRFWMNNNVAKFTCTPSSITVPTNETAEIKITITN